MFHNHQCKIVVNNTIVNCYITPSSIVPKIIRLSTSLKLISNGSWLSHGIISCTRLNFKTVDTLIRKLNLGTSLFPDIPEIYTLTTMMNIQSLYN